MKKLQRLAHMPISRVNEYEYRTANEMLVTLNELGQRLKANRDDLATASANIEVAIKLDSFKVTGPGSGKKVKNLKNVGTRPGMKVKVQENVAAQSKVVKNCLDMLDLLDGIEIRARTAFKGSRNYDQVIKLCQKRRQEVQDDLDEAEEALHEQAEQHLPADFNQTRDAILKPVLKSLDKKYKAEHTWLQVNHFVDKQSKQKILQFTSYTLLENLRNDRGFTYHQFYLIIQVAIEPDGTQHWYVNTTSKREAPSTEPLASHQRGLSFNKSANGLRLLQTHMKMDDALDIMAPEKLPAEGEEITEHNYRSTAITKVMVDDKEQSINFSTKPLSQAKLDEVVKDILADLQVLFAGRKVTQKLRYKVAKLVKGGWKIKVYLAGVIPRAGQEYKDQRLVLDRLKDELKLSDDEAQKVARILRSREVHDDED